MTGEMKEEIMESKKTISDKNKKTFYVVRDMWDGKHSHRVGGKLLHDTDDVKYIAMLSKKKTNPVQMCCLGHVCLQENFEDRKSMLDAGIIYDIGVSSTADLGLQDDAVAINDDRSLTIAQKEKKLVSLFKDSGITLKFVNTIFDLPKQVADKYKVIQKEMTERKF